MHALFRLPHFTGVLLLAAAPFAAAESPLPDPVAPAVIGRPLDQIRPARSVRAKPAAKPKRARQVAGSRKAVAEPPSRALVAAPAAAVAAAPAADPAAASPQRVAKAALDDRADSRVRVPDDVGQGTRFARKPLGPGAYFSSRDQALVQRYYEEARQAARRSATWKIGEPVPPDAALTGVPDALRAALPAVPPGHQYVQVDGEVVLVAVRSRMVVDGVPRGVR